MKYRISCDYCREDNFFEILKKRPARCSRCHSPMGHLQAEPVSDDMKSLHPDGIKLTYVKTGEKIRLQHSEITVLGRQAEGREVLGKIPQISREHCKIEFVNGHYAVTDLNSLNGTFYGERRRDCLKHQQVPLEDGEMLTLGRESFKIALKFRKKQDDVQSGGQMQNDQSPEYVYKCKACGKIHSINLSICDECGSYGQLEPIDKKMIDG